MKRTLQLLITLIARCSRNDIALAIDEVDRGQSLQMILLKSNSIAPQQHPLLEVILGHELSNSTAAIVVGIYCQNHHILAAKVFLDLAEVRRLRTADPSRITPEGHHHGLAPVVREAH